MRDEQTVFASWFGLSIAEVGVIPLGNSDTWDASLLTLNVVSDALISASYYSIPVALLYFVRRRRIKFNWIVACVAVFFTACGTLRLLAMWNVSRPNDWVSGGVKALAAAAIVPAVFLLVRSLPMVFAVLTPPALRVVAGTELNREMQTRQHAETALRHSQQTFQHLFEDAPDAMILLDQSSRVVRANAHSLTLFGLTTEEITGRTLESLLPERCRARHHAHLENYLTSAPRCTNGSGLELIGRRNDGQEFPADILLSRLEMMEEPHVLAVIRDITERTRATEALAASEARYRHNFESIPIALFEVDFTEVVRLMHRVRPQTSGDWPGWFAVHPEFVITAMRSARILEMNPMALRLFGATSKEQIIASLEVIQSAPAVIQQFAEDLMALERGELYSVHETTAQKIDGTPISLLQTVAFPRPESRGRALFSAIDITRRKQAERERDQFFELSHDLFGIADFDGYFKRLNPAWEKTLGYTAAELVGMHFSSLIEPDDLPATIVRHEQVLSRPGEHAFDTRYRAKDGKYRWMSGHAVSDPRHRLIYFTLRDITERRRIQEAMRQQNEQLETINRELEAFSYSISHDLRAPLRHIDGFANLLRNHAGSSLDATSQRYLCTISQAAKTLGELVDDLLDFSRIGRTALRLEVVDNAALVADVLREDGFDHHAGITWDISPLPNVTASKPMLRQVWFNLIDNAVKYSHGTPQPKITITGQTDPTSGEHRFAVRDNGVGFDMAYTGKLFGVFQRLHGPNEFEGTGIGLANVRRIVLRHGGRVWAEGHVGDGAIFHFALPVVPPPGVGSGSPFTRT